MDWGSLAGLILGIGGILVGQVLEGGHLRSLVQPAAFIIVVVGTIGAVLLQSGIGNFMRGVMRLWTAFVPAVDDEELSRNMALWSATARREGFLSLERFMTIENDPFIQQGLRLIIDGVDPMLMRELLNQEISAYEARGKTCRPRVGVGRGVCADNRDSGCGAWPDSRHGKSDRPSQAWWRHCCRLCRDHLWRWPGEPAFPSHRCPPSCTPQQRSAKTRNAG